MAKTRQARRGGASAQVCKTLLQHLEKYWKHLFGHALRKRGRKIAVPRTNSGTNSTDKVKHARCVHEAFAHCARWENLAGARRRRQFLLRTALGPVDDNLHYIEGDARVVLRGAIEAYLVLDTGATITVISGHIARELDLPFHGKPVEVELAGGGTRLFARATVCVCIGTNWQTTPCLVPWPIDAGKCTKNLLGMEGLLDRHIFCLACDELHLFRRQGQESVEAVS